MDQGPACKESVVKMNLYHDHKLLPCYLYFIDDCFSNLNVQWRIRKLFVLERWCSNT